MTVHVSTVGYYGVHYREDRTIEVAAEDLSPCPQSKRIARHSGFEPMLLSEKIVRQHALPSAVVWRSK